MILGIDPGFSGALAWLTYDGKVADMVAMPVIKAGNKTELNAADIVDALKKHRVTHCALERAQSMPGQGVSSTFNYGAGYGLLRGLLHALAIPYELVPPTSWTSHLHTGLAQNLKAKEKSRLVAARLFPSANFVLPGCRTPHEGLIDAVLIAEYGRRRQSIGMQVKSAS